MPVSIYNAPYNLLELLDNVLRAALTTRFYRSILGERRRIESLNDLADLPIIPIANLRRQPLADVAADPDRIGWVFGRYRGRKRNEIAVAEGADETALRYAIFRDALKDALPSRRGRTGVVVTTPQRRYFAAEVATMLGNAGVATHVITDLDRARSIRMLRSIRPHVLVPLSGDARDESLPPPKELSIRVRQSPAPALAPRLDLYMVDELGFLGHSIDGHRWTAYNDLYYYELSGRGRLVVTALRNRVFPLLRIETEDEARLTDEHHLEIVRLAD